MADILDQDAGSELFASYEAEWKVCAPICHCRNGDSNPPKARPGRSRAETRAGTASSSEATLVEVLVLTSVDSRVDW